MTKKTAIELLYGVRPKMPSAEVLRLRHEHRMRELCGGKGGTPGPCPGDKKDSSKPRPERADKIKDMLANDKGGDKAVEQLLEDTKAADEKDKQAGAKFREFNAKIEEFKQIEKTGDAVAIKEWKDKNAESAQSIRDEAISLAAQARAEKQAALDKALGVESPAIIKVAKDTDLSTQQAYAARDSAAWLANRVDSSLLGSKVEMNVKPIPTNEEQRAYYDDGAIKVSKFVPAETVTHEFGHHLNEIPHVKEMANAFHEHRFGDEKPVSMRSVCKSCGYDAGEKGVKDDMEKTFGAGGLAYYAGKKYEGGQTELVSMGLEKLHRDPSGFAKADPEYFKFMRSVLRGDKLK